jgi:hypothetical protein
LSNRSFISSFIRRPAPGADNDGDEDIDHDTIQVAKKRTKNSPFILEVDDDGRPLLLDVADLNLDKKKAVIREFISKHYSQCCL